MLPTEYGGKAGSMNDLHGKYKSLLLILLIIAKNTYLKRLKDFNNCY